MKNKILKTFLFFVLFSTLLITASFAVEIKEDVADYESDVYIIGSTRFDANQTITATMAANAGLNEAKVQVALGNNISKLNVAIYFYDAIFGDWYEINKAAKAELIEDTTTIQNIEDNLNIFYEEGVEKTLEVKYDGNGSVDTTSLSSNVEYDSNSKTFTVPATTFTFTYTETKTVDGEEVKVNKEVVTNVDKNLTAKSEDEIKEPVTVTIPENAAMKVGNEYFEAKDLATAIVASDAETPVTLLTDLTLDTALTLDLEGKSVVLNLNGKTIDSSNVEPVVVNSKETAKKSYAVILKSGELLIENGTLKTKTVDGYRNILNEGAILKVNGVNLTGNYNIDTNSRYSENVATTTISASELTADFACTTVWTKGTVNIEKSELISDIYCVSGNGTQCDAIINITDSTLESYTDVGVYMPSTKTLNIKNSTITGKSGIEIVAGITEIYNSEIYATGDYIKTFNTESANGSWVEGSAIFIRVQKDYNDNGQTRLYIDSNSKLTSKNGDGVRIYECKSSTADYGADYVYVKYSSENTTAENGNPINIQQLENTGITDLTVTDEGIGQRVVNTEDELAKEIADSTKATPILLNKDIELLDILEVAKTVTLNLNGHTLTGKGDEVLMVNGDDCEVTIKNGNIVCEGSASVVVGEKDNYTGTKAVLNIEEDVTVTTDKWGVYVVGPNTVANIYGKVIVPEGANPDGWAVGGNGNPENAGTTINIYEGALIESKVGLALYLPQEGVTNIDGTVKGHSGIGIKAGTLNVNEKASLIATGKSIENDKLEPNGSGISASGDIIFVECHNNYADNVHINVWAELAEDADSNIIRVFKPVNVDKDVKVIDGLYKTATRVTLDDGSTVTTYTK